MLQKRILKQMLDFHKATLENSFSMTTRLQCQAENIFNFFRHYSGMNDEAKKVMDRRISEYEKGIDDLKKAMDKGYTMVEHFHRKNTLSIFEGQTANTLKAYLDQVKGMPPEIKQTMEQLSATYKAGCDAFRKYIDKNVWHIEDDSHMADILKIKMEQMQAPSPQSTFKAHP